MKKQLCLLYLCLPLLMMTPFFLSAQDDKGVKWTTGLSWEQVKQKAKQENKYIFLDCFTTWCGPCKMMDRDVYTNDTVANYFNDKFISVKVQMDKTYKDNEQVKSWYKDVATINQTYHVEGYPTLIYLNPDATIADHQSGYKGIKEILAIAQAAIVPGKVYDDPYSEYNKLVASYKEGNKDYNKYPMMIITAYKSHEDSFCHQLLKEYSDYMLTLSPSERYTKDRIKMWSYFTFSSDSRVFQFFYKDANLIDKVMNEKGYANLKVVDKAIWIESVVPFLQQQAADSKIAVTGGYLANAAGKHTLKTDSSEADWKKLNQILRRKYGKACAERNVIAARVEWYRRHWNYAAAGKYKVIQMNKYWPREATAINIDEVNNIGFEAFRVTTDKEVINGFIKWLEIAGVRKSERSNVLDTYANLLYKAGRVKEAIEWEEKAGRFAPSDKEIQEAIKNMKKGKPTYGAVWAYK